MVHITTKNSRSVIIVSIKHLCRWINVGLIENRARIFLIWGLVIIFPITWQFWNTPYFQTKPSISFVRPSSRQGPADTFLRREESQDLVQQRIDEAKYKESYGQLGWALVPGGQVSDQNGMTIYSIYRYPQVSADQWQPVISWRWILKKIQWHNPSMMTSHLVFCIFVGKKIMCGW